MAQHVEVTGAYGRTYSTLKAALTDWRAGLDFRTTTGPYVNRQDAEAYGLGVVVRYGRNGERVGTLRRHSDVTEVLS